MTDRTIKDDRQGASMVGRWRTIDDRQQSRLTNRNSQGETDTEIQRHTRATKEGHGKQKRQRNQSADMMTHRQTEGQKGRVKKLSDRRGPGTDYHNKLGGTTLTSP